MLPRRRGSRRSRRRSDDFFFFLFVKETRLKNEKGSCISLTHTHTHIKEASRRTRRATNKLEKRERDVFSSMAGEKKSESGLKTQGNFPHLFLLRSAAACNSPSERAAEFASSSRALSRSPAPRDSAAPRVSSLISLFQQARASSCFVLERAGGPPPKRSKEKANRRTDDVDDDDKPTGPLSRRCSTSSKKKIQ